MADDWSSQAQRLLDSNVLRSPYPLSKDGGIFEQNPNARWIFYPKKDGVRLELMLCRNNDKADVVSKRGCKLNINDEIQQILTKAFKVVREKLDVRGETLVKICLELHAKSFSPHSYTTKEGKKTGSFYFANQYWGANTLTRAEMEKHKLIFTMFAVTVKDPTYEIFERLAEDIFPFVKLPEFVECLKPIEIDAKLLHDSDKNLYEKIRFNAWGEDERTTIPLKRIQSQHIPQLLTHLRRKGALDDCEGLVACNRHATMQDLLPDGRERWSRAWVKIKQVEDGVQCLVLGTKPGCCLTVLIEDTGEKRTTCPIPRGQKEFQKIKSRIDELSKRDQAFKIECKTIQWSWNSRDIRHVVVPPLSLVDMRTVPYENPEKKGSKAKATLTAEQEAKAKAQDSIEAEDRRKIFETFLSKRKREPSPLPPPPTEPLPDDGLTPLQRAQAQAARIGYDPKRQPWKSDPDPAKVAQIDKDKVSKEEVKNFLISLVGVNYKLLKEIPAVWIANSFGWQSHTAMTKQLDCTVSYLKNWATSDLKTKLRSNESKPSTVSQPREESSIGRGKSPEVEKQAPAQSKVKKFKDVDSLIEHVTVHRAVSRVAYTEPSSVQALAECETEKEFIDFYGMKLSDVLTRVCQQQEREKVERQKKREEWERQRDLENQKRQEEWKRKLEDHKRHLEDLERQKKDLMSDSNVDVARYADLLCNPSQGDTHVSGNEEDGWGTHVSETSDSASDRGIDSDDFD